MEQTAVEWLVSKLPQRMLNYLKEEIEQAKEMEKEQQEKMYSEEDLEVAYFEGREGLYLFNDWFEKFKKR